MNYRIIWKLLSSICFAFCIAFLLSWGAGWIFQGKPEALTNGGWALSCGITFILGLAARLLGYGARSKIFHKEGLAVIGLGWLMAGCIGALPYWLILPNCSFINALFESISGLTTTGASIFTEVESLPKSLLFWRSLSQWIGGLGVIVLFVALLPSLGAGAKFLYSNEASGQSKDMETSRIQDGALHILYLYIALSALCVIALEFFGLSWFESICQMFATLSTGGFSTRNAGIAEFGNPAVEWTLIVFMALGATSFFLMLKLIQAEWRSILRNSELIAYLVLLAGATVATTLMLNHTQSDMLLLDKLRTAAFQITSIATTTGFATADYTQWLPFTQMLLLCLMVIGGCSGSTAGGIKIIRSVLAFKIAYLQIERCWRSRVFRPATINGKSVSEEEEDNTLRYLILVTIVTLLAAFCIAFLEPQMSPLSSISASIACLFSIGPAFAELGPTQNYAALGDSTKTLLALIMIMGRLEFYAILALFMPAFWRKLS